MCRVIIASAQKSYHFTRGIIGRHDVCRISFFFSILLFPFEWATAEHMLNANQPSFSFRLNWPGTNRFGYFLINCFESVCPSPSHSTKSANLNLKQSRQRQKIKSPETPTTEHRIIDFKWNSCNSCPNNFEPRTHGNTTDNRIKTTAKIAVVKISRFFHGILHSFCVPLRRMPLMACINALSQNPVEMAKNKDTTTLNGCTSYERLVCWCCHIFSLSFALFPR